MEKRVAARQQHGRCFSLFILIVCTVAPYLVVHSLHSNCSSHSSQLPNAFTHATDSDLPILYQDLLPFSAFAPPEFVSLGLYETSEPSVYDTSASFIDAVLYWVHNAATRIERSVRRLIASGLRKWHRSTTNKARAKPRSGIPSPKIQAIRKAITRSKTAGPIDALEHLSIFHRPYDSFTAPATLAIHPVSGMPLNIDPKTSYFSTTPSVTQPQTLTKVYFATSEINNVPNRSSVAVSPFSTGDRNVQKQHCLAFKGPFVVPAIEVVAIVALIVALARRYDDELSRVCSIGLYINNPALFLSTRVMHRSKTPCNASYRALFALATSATTLRSQHIYSRIRDGVLVLCKHVNFLWSVRVAALWEIIALNTTKISIALPCSVLQLAIRKFAGISSSLDSSDRPMDSDPDVTATVAAFASVSAGDVQVAPIHALQSEPMSTVIDLQEAASATVTPQRAAPGRVTPERAASEQDAREQDNDELVTPGRDTIERDTPERDTFERVTLERVTPERVTPERDTPERDTPERDTPERDISERVTPERVVFEQVTTILSSTQPAEPQAMHDREDLTAVGATPAPLSAEDLQVAQIRATLRGQISLLADSCSTFLLTRQRGCELERPKQAPKCWPGYIRKICEVLEMMREQAENISKAAESLDTYLEFISDAEIDDEPALEQARALLSQARVLFIHSHAGRELLAEAEIIDGPHRRRELKSIVGKIDAFFA